VRFLALSLLLALNPSYAFAGALAGSRIQDALGRGVTSHLVGSDRGIDVYCISGCAGSGGGGGGPITDGVSSTVKATVTGALALKVDGSAVTQPVSGSLGRSWTLGAGTDTVLVSNAFSTESTLSAFSAKFTAFDADTGAGIQMLNGAILKKPASGGAVDFGTSSDPIIVAFGSAQAVTLATIPLAAGAATAAKQPALGTAGSASADVITVQGVASMTPLKVDGSGVTQPVSIAAAVTTNTTLTAETTKVIGTVNIATSQTIGLAAGANAIGSVAVTSEIPGTGATNLGKAEDAAAASGDTGVAMLGVRTDPSTTSPTSANGDYGNVAIDYMGAVPIAAHPGRFSCFVPLTATVTTQCQAAPAAGLRAYVTSLQCSNGAATVQGVDVVYGTGAACVTGITALTHKYQMGTNGTTTSPMVVSAYYGPASPLVPAAANAICVRPTAATAFGCTITGFIAP
jgi:hypothetical protein